MKKLLLCAAAAMTVSSVVSVSAQAQTRTGRQLDVITDPLRQDVVRGTPVEVREVVPIFWDQRCASVEYTFNTNQGANVGFPDEISTAELADAVQDGLDRWNENPSSYIEMNITNQTDLGARPRVPGDFINEITFITPGGFGALASAPSFSLAADTTFAPGDDLDLDGDSDVYDPDVEGQNVCTDIDGDGDIEFPAGDYAAGTILDNDVQFSSTVAWELNATSNTNAEQTFFDVDAVSTHEFGHSHGLSHALINQISESDGTGSTMFPFIDGGDSAAELGSRSLHIDDLAASAYIYQEGVGTEPITQLQPGDVAFDDAFDVISGDLEFDPIFTGTGSSVPLVGGAVSMATLGDGVLSMSYSGEALVFDIVNGPGLQIFFPESYVSGAYNVPVPKGGIYRAELEALDGDPAAGSNISTTAFIADLIGTNVFPEEGWTRGRSESGLELSPGNSQPIPSFRDGVDMTANNEAILTNAGPLNFIGFTLAGVNEMIAAEVFDRQTILDALDAGFLPVAGTYRTGVQDASFVPRFIEARLSIGRVNDDGELTIRRTLRRQGDFIGQDGDAARFNFNGVRGLARQIRRQLRNPNNVLVLELETNDMLNRIGPSGSHTNFVGLSQNFPNGTSFLSTDRSDFSMPAGGTTSFLMELRFVNPNTPLMPMPTAAAQ